MIYRMPKFEYLDPRSVEEALSFLLEHGDKAKLLAGGTDLLVSLKHREITPSYLIGLSGLNELNYIRQENNTIKIGTLATHQAVTESKLVQRNCVFLATACGKVGTPQIRNMGTVGGNLCNAGPSADSAPPLLALDARVRLVSSKGNREIALESFFSDSFRTVIENGELLTEIIIPSLPSKSGGSYQFLTKRTMVGETLVGIAALVVVGSDPSFIKSARIAFCSVSPMPMRARRAESILKERQVTEEVIEEAAAAVAHEAKPRSRGNYRKKMCAVLAKRAIKEALARATC